MLFKLHVSKKWNCLSIHEKEGSMFIHCSRLCFYPRRYLFPVAIVCMVIRHTCRHSFAVVRGCMEKVV